MKRLLDALDREWTWTRPRLLSRVFELRAGDEVIATLETLGAFGARMAGETAEGRWDLRHEGFVRGRTVVRREGDETVLLEFRPGWFGAGEVRTARGDALRWKRGDLWGCRWRLLDPDGHLQVEFARRPAFLKTRTAVTATDAGRSRADLTGLVLLGFFLLRLIERQSHAT